MATMAAPVASVSGRPPLGARPPAARLGRVTSLFRYEVGFRAASVVVKGSQGHSLAPGTGDDESGDPSLLNVLVPTEFFNGQDIESVAADAIRTAATLAAVKLCLDEQKQGTGNPQLAQKLTEYVNANPMRDGGIKWVRELMYQPDLDLQTAGMRVLELRKRFAKEYMDWGELQSLTHGCIEADNSALMAGYMARGMSTTINVTEGGEEEAQE